MKRVNCIMQALRGLHLSNGRSIPPVARGSAIFERAVDYSNPSWSSSRILNFLASTV